MLPNRIAKQQLIVSAPEPVSPAILLVCPTAREIRERRDVVIGDCLIADCRTDDPVTTPLQPIDDPLQPTLLDRELGGGYFPYCLLRGSLLNSNSYRKSRCLLIHVSARLGYV
jgi:hypothetical protein